MQNIKNEVVIDVIGAGAMGLLFASRLKLSGNKVRLWCRTTEQANHIRENGIVFTEAADHGLSQIVYFDTVLALSNVAQMDFKIHKAASLLTIIAVKQSGINQQFLHTLKLFSSYINSGFYMCIQNGLGHINKLQTIVEDKKLIQAVTSEAALIKEGEIVHTGYGITYLENTKFDLQSLQLIEQCLNMAGIQSLVSNAMDEYIYKKLLINAVINPLTAIFRVENGVLPSNPARLKLMKQLFDETYLIIKRQITLSVTFEDILDVCVKTAQNKSSMYADLINNRATEIESINGAIVRLAEENNMKAPINETVYLLVLAQHP